MEESAVFDENADMAGERPGFEEHQVAGTQAAGMDRHAGPGLRPGGAGQIDTEFRLEGQVDETGTVDTPAAQPAETVWDTPPATMQGVQSGFDRLYAPGLGR